MPVELIDLIKIVVVAMGFGFSLAMDAFSVSLANGLNEPKMKFPRVALIAGTFAVFQGLMPIIGYFVGRSFAEYVVSVDHWIAFGLLILIGINMIRETIWGDDDEQDGDFGFRSMLIMAIATSIDALAVGISMAFLNVNIWISATVICAVTLVISAAGVYLGSAFGSRLGSKAGIVGGLILIAIGIKIVVEHVWL